MIRNQKLQQRRESINNRRREQIEFTATVLIGVFGGLFILAVTLLIIKTFF